MNGCDRFDCEIPAVGIIWNGLGQSMSPNGRFHYCEGHLLDNINQRIAEGRPFTVVPWQVAKGTAAA